MADDSKTTQETANDITSVSADEQATPTVKAADVKTPKEFTGTYHEGVGRRKTAIARVRLIEDKKKPSIEYVINDKSVAEYFDTDEFRNIALEPFTKTKIDGGFVVSVKTHGGGSRGQAEAARLGLSRALIKLNPDLRTELKLFGLLTRDPRMVERKKPGLKKARRSAQWSKR